MDKARAAVLSKVGPSGKASAVAMTTPRGEYERLREVSEVIRPRPCRLPTALKRRCALRSISEASPRLTAGRQTSTTATVSLSKKSRRSRALAVLSKEPGKVVSKKLPKCESARAAMVLLKLPVAPHSQSTK